ncbi:DUF2303 family protein [Xanthobacter sediminis]
MTDETNPAAELLAAPSIAFAGAVEGPAVERIAELAREASKPEILQIPTRGLGTDLPETVPMLWDRHLQQVIPLLEHVRAAKPPRERRGTAKVSTLASFIALANRHKDEGSAIFAATAWPEPKLTAVIDYHSTDHVARRGAHRIVYDFPVTSEFTAWVQGNGKEMNQVAFAAFIEDHASELTAPLDGEVSEFGALFKTRIAAPNELIDLSRELEVFEGAQVKQGVRQQSGERQVIFSTQHTDANGEPVDIPGLFVVSVRPFLEGDCPVKPVRLLARIRYRIKGGGITWFFELYRWEEVMRDRVQQDLARAAKETGLPAYEGAPEMTGAG